MEIPFSLPETSLEMAYDPYLASKTFGAVGWRGVKELGWERMVGEDTQGKMSVTFKKTRKK